MCALLHIYFISDVSQRNTKKTSFKGSQVNRTRFTGIKQEAIYNSISARTVATTGNGISAHGRRTRTL